jgi:hypothetical protein
MRYQVFVSFDNGKIALFPAVAGNKEKAIKKSIEWLENYFNAKVIMNSDRNYPNSARIVDFWGVVFHDISFECVEVVSKK